VQLLVSNGADPSAAGAPTPSTPKQEG
jgi:hypothetical protein